MALCQACGKPNLEDARFCYSCGSLLSQTPPVKVEVKSPLGAGATSPMPSAAPIYTPRQIPRHGSCYYHPELPSYYVCARCGRSICAGCNKQYGALSFCPECYYGLASKIGASSPYGSYQYPVYQYPVEFQQPEQRRSLF
jgi:hypothetical protein